MASGAEAAGGGPRRTIEFVHPAVLATQALAAVPLRIRYALLPSVAIQTVVTGAALHFANVSVVYRDRPIWALTLSQALPRARIEHDIVAGALTIERGGRLDLTLAAPGGQKGLVMMGATLHYGGVRQPFSSAVATWSYPGR